MVSVEPKLTACKKKHVCRTTRCIANSCRHRWVMEERRTPRGGGQLRADLRNSLAFCVNATKLKSLAHAAIPSIRLRRSTTMATVTHYIRSHYDPKDKEALQIATGQIPAEHPPEAEEEDPWQTESAFGAERRIAAAPRFVPAAISYDEVNNMLGGMPQAALQPPALELKEDVGGWYRSLTKRNTGPEQKPLATTSQSSFSTTHISTPDPGSVLRTDKPAAARARTDKNNWFITRVLQSEPPPSTPSTPASTLADILEREPPVPKQPVKPPVFLALGPSNKGWGMLQQSGWNEGEGLGANAPRRTRLPESWSTNPTASSSKVKLHSEPGSGRVQAKTERQEVALDLDGEITELRAVEVVDLTLSDSDSDNSDEDEIEAIPGPSTSHPATIEEEDPASSHSKPLLTPIPTVLKSDRLGIGLKAKTVGPYKASKKRVTHNQAALAAHVRANEDMRRMKALIGRGSRGFARLAKAESEQRRRLIASLNEP